LIELNRLTQKVLHIGIVLKVQSTFNTIRGEFFNSTVSSKDAVVHDVFIDKVDLLLR